MIREIDTSQPCVCGGKGVLKIDWSKPLHDTCYIKCEKCGRETERCDMPWIAWEEEWNNHRYRNNTQRTIFEILGEKE